MPGRFLRDLDNVDYLSIFDDFSDGVIVTNADGVIVYYNRAMSRIDELHPDNVISFKITDVYDLDNSTSIIMPLLTPFHPCRCREKTSSLTVYPSLLTGSLGKI